MRSQLFLRIVLLLHLLPLFGAVACAQDNPNTGVPEELAGNEQVAKIMRSFAPRGVQSDGSQPTPPLESLKNFTLREDFKIELVASEPDISQPLFLSWDSKGRLWVVEYRQYQYPAGLKVVRFDQHLRAVFDNTPAAPPHHVPGQDRITVYEDRNGDGVYDSHKSVITGLNIASSVAIGRGGIWVLNPPYLLFYPDKDGDAVPDADPVVHLSGFGLQDTHSVANSLMWGPDGWLYGANGSTTGGTVSSRNTPGITFQGQCIWRYDPRDEIFEIYAEGGGNTFSLDIDAQGRVFSGTNGGNTRGWYYPQGSYSRKNWGKHGPLTNRFAFGFFEAMPLEGDKRRFAQAFTIYEGDLFPPEFVGSILAPNAMQNLVWFSQRIPNGSSYRTVDQPDFVRSSDRWFRPVYAGVGPDGALYLADWYDTRLSHVSPTDDWHKESGRVYRVLPSEKQAIYSHGDLSKQSVRELTTHFRSNNKWLRQRAALEIGWKELSTEEIEILERLCLETDQLEALWALHTAGTLQSELLKDLLDSNNPNMRRWAVRILGDRHEAQPRLIALARVETDVQVRSQLAASARRLDAQTGLAIAAELLRFEEDQSDPQMPLMIWWAFESHAADWNRMRQVLSGASVWTSPIMRETVASRLMERYATDGSPEALQRCAELAALAPQDYLPQFGQGLTQAFQGRSMPPLPDALRSLLQSYQSSLGTAGLVLAIAQGDSDTIQKGVQLAKDPQTQLGLRVELLEALSNARVETVRPLLLSLATGGSAPPALRRVAIQGLVNYEGQDIALRIAKAFDGQISAEHDLRATGCRTLASRASWAVVLLREVEQWRLRPSDIPPDVVQTLRSFSQPEISELVDQVFGPVPEVTSPEVVAEIGRLTKLLQESKATSNSLQAGHQLFQKHCGSCHRLFGEGQSIGPALDNYDRKNLKFWLPAILAPSLEIREGYQTYAVVTVDDRVITGMIHAQDADRITIRAADNKLTLVQRAEIEHLQALPTSLMPTDSLKPLTDEQLKQLFDYLRSQPEQ